MEAVATTLIETMAINGGCSTVSDCLAQNIEIYMAKQAVVRHGEMVREYEIARAAEGPGGALSPPTPPPAPHVPEYQCERTVRFGTIALLWGGVTSWCRFSFVADAFPGTGFLVALEKAAVNQLIFGPILHAGVYFFNNLGRTGDSSDAWQKVKRELFWTQVITVATKLPLNTFCFFFIKGVPMQVLFMRCYDIVYYIFVAHISAREEIEALARGDTKGGGTPPNALSPQPADGKEPETTPGGPKKTQRGPCKCMQSCVVS